MDQRLIAIQDNLDRQNAMVGTWRAHVNVARRYAYQQLGDQDMLTAVKGSRGTPIYRAHH